MGGWFYIATTSRDRKVTFYTQMPYKSRVEDTGLNLSNGRASGVHPREADAAVRR